MNTKSVIFLFSFLLLANVLFEQSSSAELAAKNFRLKPVIASPDNCHFTAKLSNDSKVILKWSKTDSSGTSHFVVQRSLDGVSYDDIAVIFVPEDNINSIKRYSYADKISSLSNKLVYYRLKIADANGKYKYSDIVIISLENPEEGQLA